MTIRFDNLVADFYAVETMFHSLTIPRRMLLFPEFFARSAYEDKYPLNTEVNRLWKLLEVWRTENHPPIARMLRDTCFGMALGEVRHATEIDRYHGNYEIKDPHKLLRASNARKTIYSNLHKYSLKDVDVLETIYNCTWCNSFGGFAWGKIANHVRTYEQVDATTFIDTVVHAVHNGGCAFDKGLFVTVWNSDRVGRMLDAKFSGSILNMDRLSLGVEVMPMLRSYVRIMEQLGQTVTLPEYLSTHETLQYASVEWKPHATLELEINEDRIEREYCYDCSSYTCHCEDYEDNPYEIPYKDTPKGKQEKLKKLKENFEFKNAKTTKCITIR